ncbi:MAG: efflux RND transporter periplasmic adaptor subunit [Burkholderiales bacterium]|nr:MAG: efflux RND transporter periplasmic adaptor subunit [Burkholderiales bacterium]
MSSASFGKGIALLAALGIAAAGGYWYGGRHAPAVHDEAAGAAQPAKGERKILYYRNPMGLPDISQTPKKDSMGMDYIPVYEGEEEAGTGVKLSTAKVQRLGVRSVAVEKRLLDATVRATGRVEVDERRLATITPKFEGYVEKLFVNTTGQYVARGAPLFEAYSPELLATQREYAIAAQGLAQVGGADDITVAGMKRLAESALERLRNWDVTDEQIARLAAGGAPQRALTFRAPASGYVIERKVTQGMRFMPGEMLYQIADLSTVWVIADVFEQDIGRVRVGQPAVVRLEAYPGSRFDGRVTYVYPTLKADTRSAQVRIELANRGGRIKPAMYAQVELPAAGGSVVAVPSSAVIDSGTRQIVLVDQGEGRFEPRDVKLGARGDEFVAITEGVREGERVVVSANFLIDAESNLQAALGGLSGGTDVAGKKQVTHSATGTLDDVDAGSGMLLITHEPIDSLKWPRMTMEFAPANESIAKAVRPGAPIRFEFVERNAGEWVVTRIEAAPAPSAAGAKK